MWKIVVVKRRSFPNFVTEKDAVFVNGFGFQVYAVMKNKKTSSAFG